MHVVQIAPPWFPIPPPAYGGIERVVHDLTEGLVAAGHRVTLFAPGGSGTSAELVATTPAGIGLDLPEAEKAYWFRETSARAYAEAVTLGADVVHDHTDYQPGPGYPLPIVRTLHGPAVRDAVVRYVQMSRNGDGLVAISRRQRQRFEAAAAALDPDGAGLNFVGAIHNPTDVGATPFYPRDQKEDYAAFLGRCHWEKDPAAAIRVARQAGFRLKMALRVTNDEQPYFEACVEPLLRLNGPALEFLGEVGGTAKDELMGHAAAVIFPSPWEEPFGLVLTEAAARGTPVVAFRRGSAPEIIVDGVTGILCDDEAEMARALPVAAALDPVACRAHAEASFDRPAIARRYLAVYELMATDASQPPAWRQDERTRHGASRTPAEVPAWGHRGELPPPRTRVGLESLTPGQ